MAMSKNYKQVKETDEQPLKIEQELYRQRAKEPEEKQEARQLLAELLPWGNGLMLDA
jgi:hypothetical protein